MAQQPDANTAFDASYQRIVDAYANPETHMLCAHMWEFRKPAITYQEYDGSYQKLKPTRQKELMQVLGVMKGDPKAFYNDHSGYNSRRQRADPHGITAMATSALVKYHHGITFPAGSDVGLLLLDPVPVFVSPYDVHSVYYAEGMKPKASSAPHHPSGMLIARQGLNSDIGQQFCDMQHVTKLPTGHTYQPYDYAVNPHDPAQPALARKAYDALVTLYRECEGLGERAAVSPKNWNEVDVNAKPEHIAAIIVQDRDATCTATDWRTRLETNSELAESLYSGLASWHAVQQKLGDYAMPQMPTLVVYRPKIGKEATCDQAFSHFPPTAQNIEMLEEVIRARKETQLGPQPARPSHQVTSVSLLGRLRAAFDRIAGHA